MTRTAARVCEQRICALVGMVRARRPSIRKRPYTWHCTHLFRRILRYQPLLRRHFQTLSASFANGAGCFFEVHEANLRAIDHSRNTLIDQHGLFTRVNERFSHDGVDLTPSVRRPPLRKVPCPQLSSRDNIVRPAALLQVVWIANGYARLEVKVAEFVDAAMAHLCWPINVFWQLGRSCWRERIGL